MPGFTATGTPIPHRRAAGVGDDERRFPEPAGASPHDADLILPPNVRHSFAERGLAEHFAFLAARQWVTLHDFDWATRDGGLANYR